MPTKSQNSMEKFFIVSIEYFGIYCTSIITRRSVFASVLVWHELAVFQKLNNDVIITTSSRRQTVMAITRPGIHLAKRSRDGPQN